MEAASREIESQGKEAESAAGEGSLIVEFSIWWYSGFASSGKASLYNV